ncbi:MAG: PIN domain-containing protein [Candidatus Omnitrophota bacterium]|nr:MAG: PIN domain-containing protein [Candidatus Omnitrophota bacterium]
MRVYADTSVFGGVFDEEFDKVSRLFFDQVKNGQFHLVLSPLIHDELEKAPVKVKTFFEKIRVTAEIADLMEEMIDLQHAYLEAGIVAPKSETDALHVAIATVAECHLIVSWNFKHIVHYQKIPLYNGINQANGYHSIAIHSPQEVLIDEDKNI